MSIFGSLLKSNNEEHKKKRAEKIARIKERNEQKREYRKQRQKRKSQRHKLKKNIAVKDNIKAGDINIENN